MRNFSGLLGLGIAHPLTRWGGATNKEVHHPLVPLDGSKREYTTPMSCSPRLSMAPATTPTTFHPPSVLSSALATKLTTPVKCGAASTFNFLMVSVTALRMSHAHAHTRAHIHTRARAHTHTLTAAGVAEIRPHEGGITSNRRSACYGELLLRPCTHRPSHAGSEFGLKL